jgi:hypothetical protein
VYLCDLNAFLTVLMECISTHLDQERNAPLLDCFDMIDIPYDMELIQINLHMNALIVLIISGTSSSLALKVPEKQYSCD